MKTDHIRSALSRRYAEPEWALFFELRNATGYDKETRYADALAMNLYPSRGMSVLGFEIKVSKSDWKRELASPRKSAPIQQYCDQWWIVAPPNVVPVDELPMTWGLMIADQRVTISKEAPRLEAKPLDRGFVASILRAGATSNDVKQRADENYQRGLIEGERRAEFKFSKDLEMQAYQRLKREVAKFKEVTGIDPASYTGDSLRDVIQLARKVSHRRVDVKQALNAAAAPLETALRTLKALDDFSDLTGLTDRLKDLNKDLA